MILVTGATGTNGTEVIRQLTLAGLTPKALVRSPDKGATFKLNGVETVVGDLSKPASLPNAMIGVEKVFLISPVDLKQVALEANLIAAAKTAGVKQIVKLSVLHAMPYGPSEVLRWHYETEQAIIASKIPFTFLRPNMFMQEILRQGQSIRSVGAFYLPLGDMRVSLVDVRDIAAAAVAALTKPEHIGKTYELTGPKALTFAEVAESISAAAGRRVSYVPITMPQFIAAAVDAGVPQWMADMICELYSTFPGRNDKVADGVHAATGNPACDFERFVADHARQFRLG